MNRRHRLDKSINETNLSQIGSTDTDQKMDCKTKKIIKRKFLKKNFYIYSAKDFFKIYKSSSGFKVKEPQA